MGQRDTSAWPPAHTARPAWSRERPSSTWHGSCDGSNAVRGRRRKTGETDHPNDLRPRLMDSPQRIGTCAVRKPFRRRPQSSHQRRSLLVVRCGADPVADERRRRELARQRRRSRRQVDPTLRKPHRRNDRSALRVSAGPRRSGLRDGAFRRRAADRGRDSREGRGPADLHGSQTRRSQGRAGRTAPSQPVPHVGREHPTRRGHNGGVALYAESEAGRRRIPRDVSVDDHAAVCPRGTRRAAASQPGRPPGSHAPRRNRRRGRTRARRNAASRDESPRRRSESGRP